MKLMILDGNSVINRAFYGVRLLTTKQGEYTNAIYGFLNILDKMRQEEQPDALCVAFDLHGPTFRHEKYDQYKATRHGMPEELAQQMPVMKDVLRAMNVPIYACQGWEADDVIGTVAKRCSGAGWDCVVVTGDRDSLQLVDEHVTVKLVTTKGGQTGSTNYSPAVFREEYGFEPIRLIDLKALMGDSSDNIPGVAGVGPKTATELLLKYGTLDGVYANLTPQNMKGKLYEKLESGRENAYLSYDLATIRLNAPVDFTPGDALVAEPDKAALYALFLRLEFVKLIDKYKLRGAAAPVGAAQAFPSRGRCPSSQTGADEVGSRQGAAFDEALSASGSTSSVTAAPCHLPLKGKALERADGDGRHPSTGLEAGPPPLQAGEVLDAPAEENVTVCVPESKAEFDALLEAWKTAERVALTAAPDLETLALDDGRTPALLRRDALGLAWDFVLPALFSGALRLIVHGSKELIRGLLERCLPTNGIVFDTEVAAYLLDAARGKYELPRLTLEYCRFALPTEQELIAAGAPQAFPLRGRCPSSQTGADEVDSRQGAAFDEALSASGPTSSVTASPCHLPLKGKAEVATSDEALSASGSTSSVTAAPCHLPLKGKAEAVVSDEALRATSSTSSVSGLAEDARCHLPLKGKAEAVVSDEALSATSSTSSVTAAPCHLPLKGKALEGKALTAGDAVLLSEAAALLALYGPLTDGLREQGLEQLYYEMDLPLCAVLAKMEVEGVRVDADALHAFDEMLRARIVEAQEEIFRYAGGDFNINSPKQLGEVLFERLGLPAGKKTKTGWSTNAEVLEKLRDKHPIVGRILEYRTLTKLQATYAEGLLKVVCPDGRVRTTFQNTVTATGRLSSTEPNLQNIPVRTELGAEIRKMFVPEPGWVFVDADYSQIELRVLAHMADDKAMQAAFLSGEDVHRVTASQVFGVPLEDVTPQMRRNAKAVNFGIVYGISDFSLAEDIGVSRAEAKNYIENYLNKYHGVRDFMDAVVEQGTRLGYVSTLYGRRRYLPELKDGKYMVREAAKRMAMNSPVQGSAADVIKLAMLRVDKALRDAGLAARLVLQVHDELIVECPEAEAETVAALVTREMEGAAKLAVPLTAEAKTGRSWYEAK